MTTNSPVIGADQHETLLQGPVGAVLLSRNEHLSVLLHPLAPRALGSPVHTHAHEDEWSYVLEGEVDIEQDGQVMTAGTGELVVKPRGVPHAFWNSTDAPALILEMIAPGGFVEYFRGLAEIFAAPGPPDLAAVGALAASYDLDMDGESVPRLAAQHSLNLGP